MDNSFHAIFRHRLIYPLKWIHAKTNVAKVILAFSILFFFGRSFLCSFGIFELVVLFFFYFGILFAAFVHFLSVKWMWAALFNEIIRFCNVKIQWIWQNPSENAIVTTINWRTNQTNSKRMTIYVLRPTKRGWRECPDCNIRLVGLEIKIWNECVPHTRSSVSSDWNEQLVINMKLIRHPHRFGQCFKLPTEESIQLLFHATIN